MEEILQYRVCVLTPWGSESRGWKSPSLEDANKKATKVISLLENVKLYNHSVLIYNMENQIIDRLDTIKGENNGTE